MPIEPTTQGLIQNTDPVARELAPAGWRSRPKTDRRIPTDTPHQPVYDGGAAEREQAPSPRIAYTSKAGV